MSCACDTMRAPCCSKSASEKAEPSPELAVGGDLGRHAVLQPSRLQRAARLVEAEAQRVRRRGAAGGRAHLAETSAQLRAYEARELERVGLAGVDDAAQKPAADRHQTRHAFALEAAFQQRRRAAGV